MSAAAELLVTKALPQSSRQLLLLAELEIVNAEKDWQSWA